MRPERGHTNLGAEAGNKVSAAVTDFAVDLVDGTVSQAGKAYGDAKQAATQIQDALDRIDAKREADRIAANAKRECCKHDPCKWAAGDGYCD